MLFGPRRRRTLRGLDPDRPVLSGAAADAAVQAVMRASHAAFVGPAVALAIDEAFAAVARATGRPLAAVDTHELAQAKLACLALGPLARSIEATATKLRGERVPVAALTLRVLQ